MSVLSQFHFLRPWFLLLLVPLGLFFLKQKSAGNSRWQSIVDAHLQPYVLAMHGALGSFRPGFLIFFLIMSIFALAGPTFKKLPNDRDRMSKPLVVVLELSAHMLSNDISPSRLKRAVFKLKDFLHEHKEREVSLIAFAGDAHIVVPFTEDHQTLLNLAETLSPDIMPVAGAKLLSALQIALPKSKEHAGADMLVLTSSNLSEEPEALNQYLEKAGQELVLWVFATSAGAPLLTNEGKFYRDRSGSVIMSTLQSQWLSALAKKKYVRYELFSAGHQDIKAIERSLDAKPRTPVKEGAISFDEWFDLGPYVLAFAIILFLALSVRFGSSWWTLSLILFVIPRAEAAPISMWERPDQQAHRALIENNAEKAAELYQDDFSKGTALFKANKIDQAIEHLKKVSSSSARYNLGNAYAHAGQVDQAIAAYEQALKLDPQNEDARFNKKILEDMKKKQENQNKQDQNKQQQDKQENKPQDQNQQEQDKQQEDKQENKQQDQKQQEQDKQQENKQENKQQDQSKQEQDKQQENKQPVKQQENKQNQEPQDQKAMYYLDKLPEHNNLYLKRKFLYESRKKQGAKE